MSKLIFIFLCGTAHLYLSLLAGHVKTNLIFKNKKMNEVKKEFIKARVTPTEKKNLRKFAELRNMSLSDYFRFAIQSLELLQIKNATSTR